MRKLMRSFIFAIIPLFCAACSNSQEQSIESEKKYSAFSFEGMLIPGTLNDAKKTGFTSCESSYSGYKCLQDNPKEIFGIKPSKVYVVLNGDNNFKKEKFSAELGDVRKLSPEKLSYRQIYLDIPEDTYDIKCLEKNGLSEFSYPRTMECIETKGVHFLQKFLNENGWFESDWKSNYSYVKADMPITISVDRNKNVSIYPTSLDENLEQIKRIKEQKMNENLVIETMNGNKL